MSDPNHTKNMFDMRELPIDKAIEEVRIKYASALSEIERLQKELITLGDSQNSGASDFSNEAHSQIHEKS